LWLCLSSAHWVQADPAKLFYMRDNLLSRAWDMLFTGEYLVKSLTSDNTEISLAQSVSQSPPPEVALAFVPSFEKEYPISLELPLKQVPGSD
ncbi:hypothetical protein DSO57_1035640, partial [Entomophthora muscae]